MTYRLVKGEPLTEGEVESNFVECIDSVTPTPTISGGVITNFNIRNFYIYDGSIVLNRQTGAISGTGNLQAVANGFNISVVVAV